MKKLLLLPAFTCFLILNSFTGKINQNQIDEKSEKDTGDQVQQFYLVTKNIKDSSLLKTESLFTFTFKYSSGQIVTDKILMSHNGINSTVQPGNRKSVV